MKKLSAMVVAALLLQGCGNTDRLISKLKDGSQASDKGVVLANVTVVDQFYPKQPGQFGICINKESEELTTPLKCESVSYVSPKDVEAQKKNQLLVETARKSFGFDAFVYTYPDKTGAAQSLVTIMFVKNSPRQMLDNYGDMAYAGDFVFTIVENPETEKPEVRVSFREDYEATKSLLADAATKGHAAPTSKFFRIQNKMMTGWAQPQQYDYKTITVSRPTTTYYYVPTYHAR